MAKASPQGRKPHQAPKNPPDSATRQSNQGTGKDNRTPPKTDSQNAKPQNDRFGGHLNNE